MHAAALAFSRSRVVRVVHFIVFATVISFWIGHYHNNTGMTVRSLFVFPLEGWMSFVFPPFHSHMNTHTAVILRGAHLNPLQFRFLQHSNTKTLSRHKQQSMSVFLMTQLLLNLCDDIRLFDRSGPWTVISCHASDCWLIWLWDLQIYRFFFLCYRSYGALQYLPMASYFSLSFY